MAPSASDGPGSSKRSRSARRTSARSHSRSHRASTAPLSSESASTCSAPQPPLALSPRFAPSPEISSPFHTPAPSSPVIRIMGGDAPESRPAHVPHSARSPGSTFTAAGGVNVTPTPILTSFTPLPPPADQPEFAELLTPAQLRRRRRGRAPAAGPGIVEGLPVLAGASRLGYTTGDGDLYRGAQVDPTTGAEAATPTAESGVNDDAVTLASESSGSSSWSWGSGLEHGRRATMAVMHRFGEAIGVRRGSASSADTTDTGSSSSSSTNSNEGTSRIGRFSRALTRTMSRATNESSPERPRRVYVPRRREFTLYSPPLHDLRTASESSASLSSHQRVSTPDRHDHGSLDQCLSERVITTPVLNPVLEAVRKARLAAGTVPLQPEPMAHGRSRGHAHGHHGHGKSKLGDLDIPVRRGGSAPGRQRQFALPSVPRPSLPRSQTRVDALRGTGSAPAVVRPKSASDLLGLAAPSVSSFSHNLDLDDGIPTKPTMPGSSPLSSSPAPTARVAVAPQPAWWLDVSCPTWKDLRDIGELLGLHPLTLEDVLHQDPREKLDVYDKLGYYFIVVRALDEQYFKYTPGSTSAPPGASIAAISAMSKPAGGGASDVDAEATGAARHAKSKEGARRGWGFGRATGRAATKDGEKVEIVEDNPGKEGLEGVGVGGANLYLVVFADGIVTFHYDDVSKHTKRVLDRLILSHGDKATSDWIAHGLLDSVVDAFFPLMGYVDGAVDDMDSLTIDPRTDPRVATHSWQSPTVGAAPSEMPYEKASSASLQSDSLDEKQELSELNEKKGPSDGVSGLHLRQRGAKAGRALKKRKSAFSRNLRRAHTNAAPSNSTFLSHWMVILLYVKLFFFPVTSARQHPHESIGGKDIFDRSTMLRSITNMRRLVTGLSRLLVGKHAVVASLLKHAREHRSPGDDEAYLSDVADHILLLQTSLYHYEYILAHCQPAYLSYLNVSGAQSRGGTDMLILALSTVSMGILPMQLITGLFSMNARVPCNGDWENKANALGEPAGYGWFAGICVAVFFVACVLVFVIRWWRWVARKRWTRLRGGELPAFWDGFWGWQ